MTSYQEVDQLISQAGRALDPEKQYYTVLSKYKQGNLDTNQLKNLAKEYSFSGAEFSWDWRQNILKNYQ